MHTSQTVIGILGNVVSTCLFLSPLPTFRKILQKRSTEEFSALPYACTLLNCLLWLFYGSPFVVKGILVVTINGFGTVVEIMYLVIFIIFASSRKRRMQVLSMTGCVVAFFALVVIFNMTLVHTKSHRKVVVGIICVIVGSAMYASPLSVMRTVIKTKSTQYMPFLLSLTATLNGILWTTYALIGHDVYITVPNAMGVGLGLAQLILYACYCRGSGAHHEPEVAAEDKNNIDLEFAARGANEKYTIEQNARVDRS